MPIPGGRLQFGSQDAVSLSVYLGKKDGTGGATGLAAVELIALKPSTGAKVTLTTKLFAQVNSTDAPGVYEISVPASEWPEFGVYQARVDPADGTVDEPEPFSFERLSGAATTSPPAGNNLCTLADVQTVVGATTTIQDSLIAGIIGRISEFIHNYCDRKFPSQSFTETRDGMDSSSHWVMNPPIITLTSVKIDGATQALVNLVVYQEEGKIYHKANLFGSWPQKSVEVVYTGGYSSLPQDLVMVAIEMSVHRFKLYERKNIGVRSEGIGQGDRQYITDDFLPQHLQVLDRYRLWWGTASAVGYG